MSRPAPSPLHLSQRNVQEAFRQTVMSYDDGVEALAGKIGIQPGTLYNKANSNDDKHPPTLANAVQLIGATGNPLIAEAFAYIAGGVYVPLPKTGDLREIDQMQLVCNWSAEHGKFFSELAERREDGLDAEDLQALRRHAQSVIKAVLELVHSLGDAK